VDGVVVAVVAIVFLATLVRSALGFGEALVAVPLLALVMPVEIAAPLACLVSITWKPAASCGTARGIANPTARPGAYGSPPWTAEEDALVVQLPPRAAVKRLGRTIDAVYSRRSLLGVKSFHGSMGRPPRLRQPNRR